MHTLYFTEIHTLFYGKDPLTYRPQFPDQSDRNPPPSQRMTASFCLRRGFDPPSVYLQAQLAASKARICAVRTLSELRMGHKQG